MRKFLVLGDPQTCIEHAKHWCSALGADYLIIRSRVPLGPRRAQTMGCLQLFGEEVLPHLR